jgi:hypothetical protein
MTGSDLGNPVTISQPSSSQSVAFEKLARNVAGRVSIIAAELKTQVENDKDKIEEAAAPK